MRRRVTNCGAALMFTATLLAGALISCGHKEIVCPGATEAIEVLFEWNDAPYAEVEGMTLYFYPTDGHGKVWRFDIAGRDGGQVELPTGTYSMIACNNDLPGVTLEGTELKSTIRATAARLVDRGVYASTGMLYGTVVDEIEISSCGVRYTTSDGTVKECGRRLVRCRPDSLATRYTVNITAIKGTDRARASTARLGTVGTSISLDSNHHTSVPGMVSMALTVEAAHHSMTGSGCAFRLTDGDTEAYCRTLSVTITTDGKSVSRTIEIKLENLNIITPHNVIISIDGLEIPGCGDTPEEDVGGIDAAVDGWDVVETDLVSTISNTI